MTKFLKRRQFITAGLATAASASGLGTAVYFADRYGLIPPDHTGIVGIGETLTYATQRLLTSGHSLAREFKRSDISKVPIVNGPHPTDAKYLALLADGFKNWRLSIEGLVARPVSFSLEELRRLPAERNPNQSRTVVRALWESIDMADALHPQTLLAYGMNREALPADHGAPARLRLGRHLGWKNTKYLSRIVITDRRDLYRKGGGTWYGGI